MVINNPKDKRTHNAKGQAHGYWVVHWHSTDKLKFKGTFVNDQEVGYFEDYDDYGTIWRKEFIIL